MSLFSRSGSTRSGLLFILLELDEDLEYQVVSVLGGAPADEKRISEAEWCESYLKDVGVEDLGPRVLEERPKSLLVLGRMESYPCGEYGCETDENFEVESEHKVVTPADVREVLAPMMVPRWWFKPGHVPAPLAHLINWGVIMNRWVR